jgi:hypothetical protein
MGWSEGRRKNSRRIERLSSLSLSFRPARIYAMPPNDSGQIPVLLEERLEGYFYRYNRFNTCFRIQAARQPIF